MGKKVSLLATYKKEQRKQQNAEKLEKAQEKKRIKQEEKNKKNVMKRLNKSGTNKRLLVSCILAAIFFCICLVLILRLAAPEDTVQVLVVKKQVPVNTSIEKWDQFFALEEIPVSIIPEGAIFEPEEINGLFTGIDLNKKQIVCKNMLADKKERKRIVENPVEVSVNVSSISQMVGGTIREGDLININAVYKNVEGYESVTIQNSAYVTQAFTSSGIPVASNDKEQVVTVLSLEIDASEEKAFNEALAAGTLRISRVCD